MGLNAASAAGSTATIWAGREPAAELASPVTASFAVVATTRGATSADANASSAARRTPAGSRSSMRRLTRNPGRSMVTCPSPSRTPESIHCSWEPSPSANVKTSSAPPTIIAEAVSTVRRTWRRRLRMASSTRTPGMRRGACGGDRWHGHNPDGVSAGGTRAALAAG